MKLATGTGNALYQTRLAVKTFLKEVVSKEYAGKFSKTSLNNHNPVT